MAAHLRNELAREGLVVRPKFDSDALALYRALGERSSANFRSCLRTAG